MVKPFVGEARYQKVDKLGEGTFGVVYQANDRNKADGDKDYVVAIKKLRLGNYKDGVPVTALREIKLLQEVKHPNVIGLLDVYSGQSNVNMVLEYCITDLEAVIRDRTILLTPAEIKCCMKMILHGIEACHDKWVLHRDLKPSNILVGSDGHLKLADFGLARLFASPKARMTHQVVTRWYRPPELLFAARAYGPAVDMWSVGCIFAELMLRFAYMPGESDIDQLAKIFQARGTPDKDDWPDFDCLPAYVEFTKTPVPDHRMLFTASSAASMALLDEMMHLNPAKRISAGDALTHRYFTEEQPMACEPVDLLAKIRSGVCTKQVVDTSDGDTKTGGSKQVSASALAVGGKRLFGDD